MSRTSFFLGVLCLAAGLAIALHFAFSGLGVSEHALPPATEAREEAALDHEAFSLPVDDDLESHRADGAHRSDIGEEAVHGAPILQPKGQLLQGRVALLEPSGLVLDNLSGFIRLVLWDDKNDGKVVELPVNEGLFALDPLGAQRAVAFDVELASRDAVLANPGENLLHKQPLVVLAGWPKRTTLSVTSAESGEHLTEITVLCASDAGGSPTQHPGQYEDSARILVNGVSPVQIHPTGRALRRGLTSYYVHSPGYAWGRIEIATGAGGEREIKLFPGGGLSLQVLGPPPRGRERLLLVAGKGEASMVAFEAELTLARNGPGKPEQVRAPVHVEGLLPGTYQARVVENHTGSRSLMRGEVQAIVAEGELRYYDLPLRRRPQRVRASLAGTVAVPLEWEATDLVVTASLIDPSLDRPEWTTYSTVQKDMRRQPGGEWQFVFESIALGDYELGVRFGGEPPEVELLFDVHVDIGGVNDFAVAVPRPAQVSVSLFDKMTGMGIDNAIVSWRQAGSRGDVLRADGAAESTRKDGRFLFRAPVGEVFLEAFAAERAALEELVTLYPGPNEFSFGMLPGCKVAFEFLDGDTAIPADAWLPEPDHLDGEGRLLTLGRDHKGRLTVTLDEPGQYQFEPPALAGYMPIDDLVVYADRGKTVSCVVALEKKP